MSNETVNFAGLKYQTGESLVLWLPPLGCKFLNEATTDSVLLAAIEEFNDRTTTRLLNRLDTKYLMIKTLAGNLTLCRWQEPSSALTIKYTSYLGGLYD